MPRRAPEWPFCNATSRGATAWRGWTVSLCLALAACLCPTGARGNEPDGEFPYTAYVNADGASVRSGPGEKYYPSLKLERGAEVEVYRHDPGGWYAIRPPQGAFSWISAEFLEPLEDNLAEVTGDQVLVRVGSEFSDIRDVIQVKLDRGEIVEVYEARTFESAASGQTWYKIAPPSGEFRWISAQLVDRELTEEPQPESDEHENLLIAELERQSEALASPFEPDPVEADQGASSGGPEHAESPASDSGQPGDKSEQSNWVRAASHTICASASDDAAESGLSEAQPHVNAASSPASDDAHTPLELKAEVDAIDLALARIVAEEPTAWEFKDLELRAEALLSRSHTALERGRARRLLARMARFADIRQRYLSVMDLREQTEERNRQLIEAQGSTVSDNEPGEPDDTDSRYDGVGRLTRVLTRQQGAPQYALLDNSGDVLYYVTPAPGVNLRRYLDLQVGVTGTRSYLPDQRAQHVTAKRVEPVQSALLR